MNKKLIILIGLVLILLISVVLIFYLWKFRENKPVIPQITQINTSDWKTLINSKFNYTIKYPQEMEIEFFPKQKEASLETANQVIFLKPPVKRNQYGAPDTSNSFFVQGENKSDFRFETGKYPKGSLSGKSLKEIAGIDLEYAQYSFGKTASVSNLKEATINNGKAFYYTLEIQSLKSHWYFVELDQNKYPDQFLYLVIHSPQEPYLTMLKTLNIN